MALNVDKDAWLAMVAENMPDTAMQYLGIEVVDAGDEFITLRMPITDRVRQPMGLVHGGMYMVMAETAASMHATWGVDLSEKVPVGIEINGSHVRAATEGVVRAEGRVARRSANFIFHKVEMFLEESGELLCTARVTNYYKPVKGG